MTHFFLLSVLLGVAASSPAQLPAQGDSESIITLDRAGMVRIETTGRTAVSCELVDHVRGPFARAGRAGHEHCKLELLLDAGDYKLRLHGPNRARKNLTNASKAATSAVASIVVTPFAESQAQPLLLAGGQSVETRLPSGQAASFWVRSDGVNALNLRVVGRTAGKVALFRDGIWLTNMPFRDQAARPRPGQPLHQWLLSQAIEAGDYQLVAYGTAAFPWSLAPESDALLVSSGFERAPESRSARVTLPWTGSLTFVLPAGRNFLMAVLPESPAARVELTTAIFREHNQLQPREWDGVEHRRNGVLVMQSGDCAIEPKAVDPRCSSMSFDRNAKLLTLRGPPGLQANLFWGPLVDGPAHDGEFGLGQSAQLQIANTADYRVGIVEIPPDIDTAPLGCAIFQPLTHALIAADLPLVGTGKPLVRSFNSDGSRDNIWFHTERATHLNIATDPDRHAQCELFSLAATGQTGKLSDSPKGADCALSLDVPAGDFNLALYEGTRGIQTIRIAAGELPEPSAQTPPKNQCSFPALLEGLGAAYQIETNRAPGQSIRGLQLHREGEPDAPAFQTAAPWISQSGKPTADLFPRARNLPLLEPGQPKFFDLDRNQSQSMLFDVPEAGLYDLTTQGLLSTSCTLRTPAVVEVASDDHSGRGRNCLIAQYLRPGSYLFTIETRGESRGRLSVLLSKRRPQTGPALAVPSSSEAFFRAGAGELLQEHIAIAADDSYRLQTSARGVPLHCRLDDAQGWPVVALPSPCSLTEHLHPGDYLWTQLPQAVESMRHTALARVEKPVLWTGRKVHPLTLHTWHDALLSQSGKDSWFLNLEADLDVTFALTNRMQGRLYRIHPDKSLEPIELIPPAGSASSARAPAASAGESSESSEAEEPIHADASPVTPDDETDESSAESDSRVDSSDSSTEYDDAAPPTGDAQSSISIPAMPRAVRRDSLPPGKVIHLAAGPYKLITEHSLGDTSIRYRLFVGSEVLTPGSSREVSVPSQTIVRMPKAGTLRLKTSGDADVACRLRDASGKLVAESKDNGDDWNCAFAEPLIAGDYTLLIESETATTDTTRVSLSLPEASELGALINGQAIAVGDRVVYGSSPPTSDAVIQEISFASANPFSCALEEESGAVVFQQLNRSACHLLIRGDASFATSHFRVRLWTLDKPADVRVFVEAKPIAPLLGHTLEAGRAGLATIARAGHFLTGPNLYCLPESERGLMRACAGSVSLEAGRVVFAAPREENASNQIALSEWDSAAEHLASESTARSTASRRPFIQAQVSSDEAVFFLAAVSTGSERSPVVCAVDGGARVVTERGCFLASDPGERAVERWSLPSGSAEESRSFELQRIVATLPGARGAVIPGRQSLHWSGSTSRFALPAMASRLELILPARSWAAVVNAEKHSTELCPPSDDLADCRLDVSGAGELILWSPDASGDAKHEATLTSWTNLPKPREIALSSLYEEAAPLPGTISFRIDAADRERTLTARGASHCQLALPDGTRVFGCNTKLPPHLSAQFQLESESLPLKTILADADEAHPGFGPLPSTLAIELPQAQATPLGPESCDRMLTVARDSLLHLRADSGVVALVQGDKILTSSQENRDASAPSIDWLVPAGSYRALVRPFADEPLRGSFSWFAEPVLELAEGVGPETVIGPDETRLFRFTTASDGKIGLGLQVQKDSLDCAVLDRAQRVIGTGCQQYLALDRGTYLLEIHAPKSAAPERFHPVLLGLAGSTRGVPEEYLREFFQRTEAAP